MGSKDRHDKAWKQTFHCYFVGSVAKRRSHLGFVDLVCRGKRFRPEQAGFNKTSPSACQLSACNLGESLAAKANHP